MTDLEKLYVCNDLQAAVPATLARRVWDQACADSNTEVLVALAKRRGLPDDVEAEVAATTTMGVRLAWIARAAVSAHEAEAVLAGDGRAAVIKAAAATWPEAAWASTALLHLLTARPSADTAIQVLRHIDAHRWDPIHVQLVATYADSDKASAVDRDRLKQMWSALNPQTVSAMCSWSGLAHVGPTRLAALLLSPGRDRSTMACDTAALAQTVVCDGSTHRGVVDLVGRTVAGRRLGAKEPVSTIADVWLAAMRGCPACPPDAYDAAVAVVESWRNWSPPPPPPPPEDPLRVLARLGARRNRAPAPDPNKVTVWTNLTGDYELSRTLWPYLDGDDPQVAAAAWKVAARAGVNPHQDRYCRAFRRFADDADVCAHLYMLLACTTRDEYDPWSGPRLRRQLGYSRLPAGPAERIVSLLATGRRDAFGRGEVDWCVENRRIGIIPFALLAALLAGRDVPAMRGHGAAVLEAVAAGIETCARPEDMWVLLERYRGTFTGTIGQLLALCADICGQSIADVRLAPPAPLPQVVWRDLHT